MSFSLSPGALARSSARHPWRVVASWAVLLVAAFVTIGALLPSALTTTFDVANNPDSKRGATLLEERLRGPLKANEAIIVRSQTLSVNDPAFRAEIERLTTMLIALGPDVIESAVNYYQVSNENLVSSSRRGTIIPIVMAGDLDTAAKNIESVLKVVHETNGVDGFEVYISGNATIGHDFNEAAERDLVRGEMIGGLIALVILVLVLGALVAAIVPVIMAVVSILAALGLTAVLGQGFHFSFFVTNMITMMGLAVGIDYSLFVLSRFREERGRGRSILDAVDLASSTAGRAVLFSGLTVIIALLGMLIVPSTIYRSLAAGAIMVVSFAILASLTLLPALMRLLGDRINKLRIPLIQKAQDNFDEQRPGGFWDKTVRAVMRHPVLGVVGVTGLLVTLSIPYFDLNAGSAGVSTLPDSFQSKQGFEVLASDFRGGQVIPAEVVIDGDANSSAVRSAIGRLEALLANDPVFGPATYTTNSSGDLGLLSVQIAVDPYLDEANNGIKRLRSEYIPQAFSGVNSPVYVTGLTAINVDAISITSRYTPYVFGFVLGMSFLLLMLVFRSIVVPVKAIIMNLLSVGAAYGLIVLVSQKGYGASILGFQQVDTVEFWLPLFLFSVLFGLSMDYHVFLLSRIRERYDQTGDNTDAVVHGVRATGRLITGAALIMVAVFGGFAMGDLVMLQQVGFGLGVAVLIDATIIRCILVPASMKLLGSLNWYLPPVLSWMPRIGIEAPETSLEPSAAGGGGS
jgi:putative drug exporter of the RND superfamily